MARFDGSKHLALAVLALSAFCYVTTELLPVGLLTLIAPDLHRTPAQTGLLVTGYAVVVVVASVPLTRLTQRVPRRPLLAGTLAVFAAATLLSAVAPSYPVLLVARLLTALTQALFWSVVAPAAVALFPPEARGRVVARLSFGAALAPVLGVPAQTWIGQQAGWRVAFAVMAAVNLGACLAVTALVPSGRGAPGAAAAAPEADRRRYAMLVVAAALGITGFFTLYTYITPFLLDVSGFAPGSLGPLLLVGGVSGMLGVICVGPVLDRYPWAAVTAPLGLVAVALLGLSVLGPVKPAAVALVALPSLAYAALATAIQNRTLRVAPGSADLASAGTSSAFNAGIAGGSLLGSVLIDTRGLPSAALTGGLLVTAALLVMLGEPWLVRRTTRPVPAADCG